MPGHNDFHEDRLYLEEADAMLKGSDLRHRLLITRDAGEQVGKVQDLIVDHEGSQVLGILVDEKGWFSDALIVRWPAVLSIGEDVLIIDSKTSVAKASQVPTLKAILDRGDVLAGVHVRTTDGRDLGKFEAIYFDEKSGKILGYELSGGEGRKRRSRSFLPTPGSFEAGKDVAFVSPEIADTLQDLSTALTQNQ
jgi:uncharacterized protein YrrD